MKKLFGINLKEELDSRENVSVMSGLTERKFSGNKNRKWY
jgi:hypothetical protein